MKNHIITPKKQIKNRITNVGIVYSLALCYISVFLTSFNIYKKEINGWFSLNTNSNDTFQRENDNIETSLYSNWYQDIIGLYDAHFITNGRNDVLVGVIDTGIDSTHPLLSTNYDSTNSYSFNPTSIYPNAELNIPHGTAVAGIISTSLDNNGNYIGGISNQTTFASIRADGNTPPSYSETPETIINAINYASNSGFEIVNYSGGFNSSEISSYYIGLLQTAIDNFEGLLVVASGNDFLNLDTNPIYPAVFSNSNILVVGASKADDTIWGYSNYSSTKVDIVAPGDNITSTGFNSGTYCKSGTSFAAPMVTGVASLIKAVNPELTASEIKNIIMSFNDYCLGSFSNYCLANGRLNAFKAVKAAIPFYSPIGNNYLTPNYLSNGQTQWIKIYLQKNNVYNFKTTNSTTSGDLFLEIPASPIASGSPGGYGSNFSFNYDSTNNCYAYLRITDHETTSKKVNFISTIAHTHNATYSFVNNTTHKFRCNLCGTLKFMPHVVDAITGYCVDCGAFIGGNLYDMFEDGNSSSFGNGSVIFSNGVSLLSKDDVAIYLDNQLDIRNYSNYVEGN